MFSTGCKLKTRLLIKPVDGELTLVFVPSPFDDVAQHLVGCDRVVEVDGRIRIRGCCRFLNLFCPLPLPLETKHTGNRNDSRHGKQRQDPGIELPFAHLSEIFRGVAPDPEVTDSSDGVDSAARRNTVSSWQRGSALSVRICRI